LSTDDDLRYWADKENQRKFLEKIAQQLNFKSLDDWYSVPLETLRQRKGHGLLRQYGYSLKNALMALYPEHNWVGSKFSRVATQYWNNLSNQREFFDALYVKFGMQGFEDWYSILNRMF
jgi:hypothetical protein